MNNTIWHWMTVHSIWFAIMGVVLAVIGLLVIIGSGLYYNINAWKDAENEDAEDDQR